VFYDGGCSFCLKEISHDTKIADPTRVAFVDISAPEFEAARDRLSLEAFQAELHVRDATGQFHTGVEAFRKLWEVLPAPLYPMLSKITGLPVINAASRCGYALFARYRHLLPKTK
jgi:predicted DCC family thiol-disulfide oxidoreductase YuxK